MKQETAIILLKGACYVIAGAGVAWTTSLAQWANSGEWPGRIVWIGVILPGTIVGGSNALLAFLSGSYREYKDGRKSPPLDTPPGTAGQPPKP